MPQELDSLFLEFQNMSERITTLIHQVLIRDIRQKDSELQLLRTQINPHFIYNTLQIIQSKAYIRKAVDVAVMSELLGENLRYGLREPNREVPLSAEVSSVSKYLELMSYHYGDKLDYHLHFAESILSLPTIKLLLQPIVENSLVHGLEQGITHITVDISGYRDGEDIVLCVTDNGCGIQSQALEGLNMSFGREESHDRIGLKNVHQRLKLYYGDGYGINLQSVWGQGTCTTIRIPVRAEEGGQENAEPADGR